MSFAAWSAFAGLLLIGMALISSLIERLPLSTSMLYLGIGLLLSPLGFGWVEFEPLGKALLLERLAEVVVVISLFTSGMKMGLDLSDGRWKLPVRLAVLSMLVTVALVALAGHYLLGLSIGVAVLLGGVLAPTDPVLAADVQVDHHEDRDRLRFALTGEAGLNDGTAFPVVMLGLGLLGLHEIGEWGWRWFAVDVVWAVFAGLAIGAGVGLAVGRLVLHLRRAHREAVGLDQFLALGVIALAYGLSLLLAAYGFLAVFAAGVMLRQLERHETATTSNARSSSPGDTGDTATTTDAAESEADDSAVHPARAPAFMAHAMLGFTEQIERVGEVVAVIAVGLLLWTIEWPIELSVFIALALLVIRPVAVLVGLAGSRSARVHRALIGWFGIRGIGSIYYLMYAVNHGLPTEVAADLIGITLAVISVSVVVHGFSVKPLVSMYERLKQRRTSR